MGLFKICRRTIEDQSARLQQPKINDLFTLDATESLNYYTDQYSEVNMKIKHFRHFYIALCSENTPYDWFDMKDIKKYSKKIEHIAETFKCILAVIDGSYIDKPAWHTGLIHPSNNIDKNDVKHTSKPKSSGHYAFKSSNKTINIEIYRVC